MSILNNGSFDVHGLPAGFTTSVRVFIARQKARAEVKKFFDNLLTKPPVGRSFHLQSYARALEKYSGVDYDKALTAIVGAMGRKRFATVYKEIEVFDNKGNKLGGRFYNKMAECLESVADIVDTNAILEGLDLSETETEKDLSDRAMEYYATQKAAAVATQQPAGNGVAH